MRIAFDDAIDTYYGIINEVTTLDYALLRFDDNEPISKEIMNFNISKDGLGIHLNGYTGQLAETSGGASATYVSDYVEIPDGARITEFASIAKLNELCTNSYCVFYDENKEYIGAEIVWKGNKMDEGTIKMDYQVYNEIFGTSYDVSNLDKFVPHKVILSHYEYYDINNENPLFSKEVMIVGLSASSMNLLLAEDVYELFKKDYFPTQNFSNISLIILSVAVSPVISPRQSQIPLTSIPIKSRGSFPQAEIAFSAWTLARRSAS